VGVLLSLLPVGQDRQLVIQPIFSVRIYIENPFGGMANEFSYFSYLKGLRLRGRRFHQGYKVANFLMNVRSTLYGNQFTEALLFVC
jgi:hypothetical protein